MDRSELESLFNRLIKRKTSQLVASCEKPPEVYQRPPDEPSVRGDNATELDHMTRKRRPCVDQSELRRFFYWLLYRTTPPMMSYQRPRGIFQWPPGEMSVCYDAAAESDPTTEVMRPCRDQTELLHLLRNVMNGRFGAPDVYQWPPDGMPVPHEDVAELDRMIICRGQDELVDFFKQLISMRFRPPEIYQCSTDEKFVSHHTAAEIDQITRPCWGQSELRRFFNSLFDGTRPLLTSYEGPPDEPSVCHDAYPEESDHRTKRMRPCTSPDDSVMKRFFNSLSRRSPQLSLSYEKPPDALQQPANETSVCHGSVKQLDHMARSTSPCVDESTMEHFFQNILDRPSPLPETCEWPLDVVQRPPDEMTVRHDIELDHMTQTTWSHLSQREIYLHFHHLSGRTPAQPINYGWKPDVFQTPPDETSVPYAAKLDHRRQTKWLRLRQSESLRPFNSFSHRTPAQPVSYEWPPDVLQTPADKTAVCHDAAAGLNNVTQITRPSTDLSELQILFNTLLNRTPALPVSYVWPSDVAQRPSDKTAVCHDAAAESNNVTQITRPSTDESKMQLLSNSLLNRTPALPVSYVWPSDVSQRPSDETSVCHNTGAELDHMTQTPWARLSQSEIQCFFNGLSDRIPALPLSYEWPPDVFQALQDKTAVCHDAAAGLNTVTQITRPSTDLSELQVFFNRLLNRTPALPVSYVWPSDVSQRPSEKTAVCHDAAAESNDVTQITRPCTDESEMQLLSNRLLNRTPALPVSYVWPSDVSQRPSDETSVCHDTGAELDHVIQSPWAHLSQSEIQCFFNGLSDRTPALPLSYEWPPDVFQASQDKTAVCHDAAAELNNMTQITRPCTDESEIQVLFNTLLNRTPALPVSYVWPSDVSQRPSDETSAHHDAVAELDVMTQTTRPAGFSPSRQTGMPSRHDDHGNMAQSTGPQSDVASAHNFIGCSEMSVCSDASADLGPTTQVMRPYRDETEFFQFFRNLLDKRFGPPDVYQWPPDETSDHHDTVTELDLMTQPTGPAGVSPSPQTDMPSPQSHHGNMTQSSGPQSGVASAHNEVDTSKN